MLSTSELAGFRETVTGSFPDTAELWRKTTASDGQGGQMETWAASGSFACYLAEDRRPAEYVEAGRPVAESRWKAGLPFNAMVLPTDRLRIGGADYEVTETDAASSLSLSVTAYLRRIQ